MIEANECSLFSCVVLRAVVILMSGLHSFAFSSEVQTPNLFIYLGVPSCCGICWSQQIADIASTCLQCDSPFSVSTVCVFPPAINGSDLPGSVPFSFLTSVVPLPSFCLVLSCSFALLQSMFSYALRLVGYLCDNRLVHTHYTVLDIYL